jgi:hypothetical protein
MERPHEHTEAERPAWRVFYGLIHTAAFDDQRWNLMQCRYAAADMQYLRNPRFPARFSFSPKRFKPYRMARADRLARTPFEEFSPQA